MVAIDAVDAGGLAGGFMWLGGASARVDPCGRIAWAKRTEEVSSDVVVIAGATRLSSDRGASEPCHAGKSRLDPPWRLAPAAGKRD